MYGCRHLGVFTDASPAAQALVQELLSREDVDVTDSAATSSALRRLSSRVSTNLRSSLGEDGYTALLQRALARVQRRYPVLDDLGPPGHPSLDITAIAEGADAHTAPVLAAAVESLLAALIDTLNGLIGADMTLSLLEYDHFPPTRTRDTQ